MFIELNRIRIVDNSKGWKLEIITYAESDHSIHQHPRENDIRWSISKSDSQKQKYYDSGNT